MIGLRLGHTPKFARRYANVGEAIRTPWARTRTMSATGAFRRTKSHSTFRAEVREQCWPCGAAERKGRDMDTHDTGRRPNVVRLRRLGQRRALDACAALTPEQFTRDLGRASVRCATRWRTSWARSGFGWSAFTGRTRRAAGRRISSRIWRPADALGRGRARSLGVRRRALGRRSGARLRISGHEGQPRYPIAVGNRCNTGESRHVPSRPGDHAVAPAWRQTYRHRSHRLLPRTARRKPPAKNPPQPLWKSCTPSNG